jgi:hypothetical protein
MKSFKQNLNEQTFDSFLSLNEEDFDKFIDTLSDEELNELEEGIVSGIAKGVAAVGKGAFNLAKKAVVNKQGNVRVSTAGRADAADKKLAKIKKKQADRERLKKAQAGIDAEKAKMKADRQKEKSEETVKEEVKLDIVDAIKQVVSNSNLQEDGYSQVATGDGTDLAHNDVKNPEVLEMLNAHVGSIGIREYMNAKGALLQLQGKLATIGLTFDIPAMTEAKGTVSAPLTQFGGITGKSVTTPIDALDNENPAEGLSLQIEYEKLQTGYTKVYAKIV